MSQNLRYSSQLPTAPAACGRCSLEVAGLQAQLKDSKVPSAAALPQHASRKVSTLLGTLEKRLPSKFRDLDIQLVLEKEDGN